jgi:hypothetical protein
VTTSQGRGEASGEQRGVDQRDSATTKPAPAMRQEPARAAAEEDTGATSKPEPPRSSSGDARDHAGRGEATVTPNTSTAVKATRPRPSSDRRAQLYEQCESAARRGDCVAVKRILGRITKTDRGYRARLAKDSAIAKCLAE